MKRKQFVCAAILIGLSAVCALSSAAEESSVLGKWYVTSREYPDLYPGVIFQENGALEAVDIYYNGADYLVVEENQPDDAVRASSMEARPAVYQDGMLSYSGHELILKEDGLTETVTTGQTSVIRYGREPKDKILPNYRSLLQERASGWTEYTAEDYEGAYVLTMYGMNNAFATAAEMNLTGTGVIRDRHMTIVWVINGVTKSFEIDFNEELNKGRLYTVMDDHSYVLEKLDEEGRIILNVGMEQSQWIFEKAQE